MPSLIDIRRRVRAVKSTQQITKAMKMVSSSKLRRAQERILRSRPYAQEMLRVFNSLATRTDSTRHRCCRRSAAGRTLLIVITADRGLAGSFNANVIKGAAEFITTQPQAIPAARWRWRWSAGRAATSSCAAASTSATRKSGCSRTSSGRTRRRSPTRRSRNSSTATSARVYLVYNQFRSDHGAAGRRRAAAADREARRDGERRRHPCR